MKHWAGRAFNWLPVAFAGLYLLVLIVAQGAIRESLYSNSDAAAAPAIAELIGQAPDGSSVVLGDYAWYEGLWLLQGTGWLPFHFAVWQAIPFMLWLFTAGLAWSIVRRLTDRKAAAVTASLVICAGLGMRGSMWTLNTHGLVALHIAILGLAMVIALQDERWLTGVRGYGGAVAIGLITAPGATDQLLPLLGIGPLLLAGIALWARRGEPALARLAFIVAGVSVVGAALLTNLARNAGIASTGRVFPFVDGDGIMGHLGILTPALAQMVAHSPFGEVIGARSVVAMAGGLTALFAAALVLHAGVRQSKRALWPERFGLVAEPDTILAKAPDPGAAFAGAAVFFTAVLVANLLAWTFTSAPYDINGNRYLVGGWLAVCVLGPVLAVRLDLRWVATAGAIIVCFAATAELVHEPRSTASSQFPTEQDASAILQFAQEHGATRGYASYWDAEALMWHTRFDLKLYPIVACPTPEAPGKNCPFTLHVISSWFTPGTAPTILVTDTVQPGQPLVDARYGVPTATGQFGRYTAYVFSHDIASELGGEFITTMAPGY